MTTLPAVETDGYAPVQHRATSPCVLIVEDQEVIQELLLTVFGMSGIETIVACTVAEALAHLDKKPDFCILDLNLPDGRGTEVLHSIRDRRLSTRVAITTGAIDSALLAAARKLKPDRFFQKPYSAIDLVAWVRGAGQSIANDENIGLPILQHHAGTASTARSK